MDLDRVYQGMRTGQAGALETIISRMQAGEKTTSIILPPRSGKTDVYRVAGTYLQQAGYVSLTLMLVPNKVLRHQAADDDKWSDAWQRYGLTDRILVRELETREVMAQMLKNGERFLVATVQLVAQHLDLFTALANSLMYRFDRPLLVIGDEGHTDSTENVWGNTLSSLVDAGARLVVGTGTPFRMDGYDIIGFRREVIEERPLEITIPRIKDEEWVALEQWAGTKRKIRLRADYEMTFGDIWQGQDRPCPLCRVSDVPYEVDLSKSLPGQMEADGSLSQKSPSEARALLGKVVRSPIVIQDGIRTLIRELRRLKGMQEQIGAIVFCADDDDPGEPNAHANALAHAIRKQSGGTLRPVIATANDGKEAEERIEQFRKFNVGDVLVVKQMAGVGLDLPRVKLVGDFSPVRGPASTIQRWLRGATPFGPFDVEVLVRPKEQLGDAIFAWAVRDQGGEVETSALEKIGETLIPRKVAPPRPVTIITGTREGDIQDSQQKTVAAPEVRALLNFLDAFPELARGFTHPEAEELRRKLVERGLVVPEVDAQVADAAVTNVTDYLRSEKPEIEGLMKDLISARMARDGVSYSHDAWRQYSTRVWAEAKSEAGIAAGVKYKQITDMGALEKIREYAEKGLRETPKVAQEVDLTDGDGDDFEW